MTAITQKIRRFTGGISDQPDEQKIPGQVRDAVNCIPDVVQGLIKRPGMNLVRELDTSEVGKWFFIDKSNNFNDQDRYVGQIDNRKWLDEEKTIENPNKGKVKIWDLQSGKLMDVCYTDNIDPLDVNPSMSGVSYNIPEYDEAYTCGDDGSEDYFLDNDPTVDDLQVLTINDYTFVTNRKVPVKMSKNDEERKPPQATVELRSIAGLTSYEIDIKSLSPENETDNASRLSITSVGLPDDPPTCTGDFVQTFTNQTNGTGTGLSFRIQTTSVVDNGVCDYTTTVTILNGGKDWAVGDTVEIVDGDVTYTVKVEEINKPVTITKVSKISVAGSGFNTTPGGGGGLGNQGTCQSNTSQTITGITSENNNSFGEGLAVKLTTTSVIAPVGFLQPRAGVNRTPDDRERKCVYTTSVSIQDGGIGWRVGDTFRRVYEGVTYLFTVEEIEETGQVEKTERISATTDRENPQADDVLDSLESQFKAKGFDAERIGNSIYVTREQPFTLTTPNSILLRVLSSTNIGTVAEPNYVIQANDISEVPLQTKHNLVFQIRNSFSDADDYYVQFKGDNNVDGTGTYTEVAKPGIDNLLMPDSMPHGILRLSRTYEDDDGDTIKTFLVASFKWAARGAGDDLTVPRPSFAPEEGATFGRPINQLAFFRNRFVMLTDENVVCSVAGDFFNFFAKTAQTVSPQDPIDLQVSNNYPAVLYGAQATTAGLVLFSENAQFMLSTENDVLEPRTARTSILSTYNYNRNSNTVNLGTTVGFVSGIGRYTRFYEMANISRDQEPEVVEQSKVVERLVPGGYNYIGISKDNQLVAMGQEGMNDIWMFRYFNTGERRAQSAWVRWLLPGDLVNHALINDSYFCVVKKDDRVFLMRGDVRALQSTLMLEDEDKEEYRTFLDYAKFYNAVKLPSEKNTTFDISNYPIFSDLQLVALDVTDGRILVPKISEGSMQLRGDFPDGVILGYTFKFHIDLPKFYVKREANGQTDSWDTANVIIQRVKLNFGRIGYYETTLKRLGRDDYTQIYESKPMDKYDANELGYLPDYEQTTPVYQRNTTFTMSIHAEHPSPAVLYSATWEGQYQENYVKRL